MLSVNYCKIGDEGGVILADAISHSSSVKDVRAKYCNFGDATARSFALCLEENHARLERLDLSNNHINDAGGELLGISIKQNTHLKFLDLRKN